MKKNFNLIFESSVHFYRLTSLDVSDSDTVELENKKRVGARDSKA